MGGAGHSEDAAGVAAGLNNWALEPQRKWKWLGILSLQLMMGGGGSGSTLAVEKKGLAVRPDSGGKVGSPRSRPSSAQEPKRL